MQEFFHGAVIVCIYYIAAASVACVLRKLVKIPDELFRKMLHFILQISYIFFGAAFDKWWMASLFGFVIVAIAYPVFSLLGRSGAFSAFVNERKAGEFKVSLVLAFTMFAVCNGVCWGIIGDKYFGIACMYAWGIGDGFAALAGKKFGKHKLNIKFADKNKSWEGSMAMFITSALAVAAVMIFHGHAGILACIVVPVVGAAAAACAEMITPNGYDTVTCPLAAMAVMIPAMFLLGGFV